MSIALVDQVMRMRMKSQTEKLILLAYAQHSGDAGISNPSVDLVAAEALCSARTVKRVAKQFVESGLLVVKRKSGGRGYPTEYMVCPEALGPIASYQELRESQRAERPVHKSGGSVHENGTSVHAQGDLLAGGPVGKKGDTLMSPFPESGPVDNSEKGDTQMSPIPPVDNSKRVTNQTQKGDKNGQKGDTQMSPEPRTLEPNAERAPARPVDNFRGSAAQGSPDRHPKPPPSHTDRSQSVGGTPDDFRETLEEISEKARKHGLPPQQRSEVGHTFAFRNRVNSQVADLAIYARECQQFNLPPRKPGESFEDFRYRHERAVALAKGIGVEKSAEQSKQEIQKALGRA